MSEDSEKWQWVDEDPIEKLLQPAAPLDVDACDAGLAHYEQQHFDEAVSCFRQALEADPGRAQALIGMGACLLHLNVAEQALACFEQCLAGSVERESALFGKAVALQLLARLDESDTVYREVLQLDPDAAEPLANLIALSVARQDGAAVAEYSRRLLRVQPQSKAALQGLAMLAIHSGDQPAAVEFCKRLVEIDPETFEGWSNLRFAQQKMRPETGGPLHRLTNRLTNSA